MIVASAGEAEQIVILPLRYRSPNGLNIAQRCESFEHGCNVLVGESIIPVPAFTDNGQKTARTSNCARCSLAPAADSPAADASSVAGNARPSITRSAWRHGQGCRSMLPPQLSVARYAYLRISRSVRDRPEGNLEPDDGDPHDELGSRLHPPGMAPGCQYARHSGSHRALCG